MALYAITRGRDIGIFCSNEKNINPRWLYSDEELMVSGAFLIMVKPEE